MTDSAWKSLCLSLVYTTVETHLTDLSTAPVKHSEHLQLEGYSTWGPLHSSELSAHKKSLLLNVFLPGDLISVMMYFNDY